MLSFVKMWPRMMLLVLMIFNVTCQFTYHVNRLSVNEDCQEIEENGVILTTECIMVCERKQKSAVIRDQRCFCLHKDCFRTDSSLTSTSHLAETFVRHSPDEMIRNKKYMVDKLDIQYRTWSVAFDLKLYNGTFQYEQNILHVTKGGSGENYGDMNPAIKILPDKRLIITSAIDGNPNFEFANISLPMNQFSNIMVTQSKIYDGLYKLSVIVDGKLNFTTLNNDTRSFKNIEVYAGDSWYPEGYNVKNILIETPIEHTNVMTQSTCFPGSTTCRNNPESLINKNPSPTVSVPYWNQTIAAMEEYSICGWFWLDVIKPTAAITMLCISSETIENYILVNFKGDNVIVYSNGGPSLKVVEAIKPNVWNHLCILYRSDENNNHLNIFLNGTSIQNSTMVTNHKLFAQNNYYIAIGNDIDGIKVTDPNQVFIGMLSGWNMYNKRLKRNEILLLYHGEKLPNEEQFSVWNYEEKFKEFMNI